MSDASSVELLERWRVHADQAAASELFQRYAGRLIALAKRRLFPQLQRRVDAEDVVQSACRSFFVRVSDGRLQVLPGDDLWQLLAVITVHKLQSQLKHHTAGKRAVGREEDRQADSCVVAVEPLAGEPTPAEAAAFHDEWDRLLRDLQPLHRQMVELRLQEWKVAEIAAKVGRSERMVRIVLDKFSKHLRRQLSVPEET